MHQVVSVADFIMADDHLSLLASCHQLVFDVPSEVFRRHSLTTEEIKELCKDVKVRNVEKLKGWIRNTRIYLLHVAAYICIDFQKMVHYLCSTTIYFCFIKGFGIA